MNVKVKDAELSRLGIFFSQFIKISICYLKIFNYKTYL